MPERSLTIRKPFMDWVLELDRILRGETTCRRELFRDCPKSADINIPVGGISVVLGALGGTYGLCMGVFALATGVESGTFARACLQVTASIAKVPLLYFLTIAVTFPSLYVFNALMGTKMNVVPIFRLMVASLAVNLSVLASLGPVVAFFATCSSSYHFIVLMHVVVFGLAGTLGLGFLIQTLRRIKIVDTETESEPSNTSEIETSNQSLQSPSKLESPPFTGTNPTPGTNRRNVDWVFSCWMVAFGLVGAQMGWVLRPFVGAPNLPFEMFRRRQSNFFEAVWNAMFNVIF